jgi:pheromone shutdown protein TraB
MITLIGTAHILNLKNELNEIFNKIKPDVICIELDNKRFKFFNNMLKINEKKNFGIDMLTAISYAKKHNIDTELIDKPDSGDTNKYFKLLSFSQKIKYFIKFILILSFGLFLPYIFLYFSGRKIIKSLNNYMDGKSTDNSEGRKDSEMYKFLIKERDKHMFDRIKQLSMKYNNIVAVVGDAHINGISTSLDKNKIEFKAIRLKDYIKKPITFHSLAFPNKFKEIFHTSITILLLSIIITRFFTNLNQEIQLFFIILFWFLIMTSIILSIKDDIKLKKIRKLDRDFYSDLQVKN